MNEERLKEQVRILADKMAVMVALLYDCKEIVAEDGGIRPDVFHALLVAPFEDHPLFTEMQERPEYKEALANIRAMLRAQIRD